MRNLFGKLIVSRSRVGGGGGLLPSNRLMGMCCWKGLDFHGWIDYNVVALLEWGRTFSGFGGSENSGFKDWKIFTSSTLTNMSIHFRMT